MTKRMLNLLGLGPSFLVRLGAARSVQCSSNRLVAGLAGALAGVCAFAVSQAAWADTATPTDLTTYYRYDAMRRLTMKIGPDPDGEGTGQPRRVEKFEYDAEGRLEYKRIGTTTATAAQLAGAGEPAVSYKAELTVSYKYDAVGNKIRETSSYGLTQFSYDAADRLECTAVRMAANAATSEPTVGACAQTIFGDSATGPDRISKNTYDVAGQLRFVEHGVDGGLAQPVIEEIGYTLNGQVAYRRDANKNTSSYVYDGFDRLIEFHLPPRDLGSPTSSTSDKELYEYDANGNRKKLTKRDGQVFEFKFDALNRETLKVGPGTTGDVSTGYDLLGQVSSKSWTGSSVTYAYDAAGRRTSETISGPGGALQVSSRYDAAGNRTHVIWGADPAPPSLTGLVYAAYAYNNAGGLKSISNTNGDVLETFAYDAVGRPESLAAGNGVTTSLKYLDANGLLEWIHHDGFSGGAKIWQGFDYNSAGQIVSQSQSNPNLIWTGQPTKTTSLLYNGLNQDRAVAALASEQCAAAGAGYDCNGNLKVDVEVATNATRQFTYDAENRLTGVSKTTAANGSTSLTLAYDPLGRLLATTAGGVVTRFLYDGDRLVGEYDGSRNLLRRYVHGGGTDNPLVWFEGAGDSDRRWLHVDRQGSVSAYSLTDKSLVTYAYGPYGEAQSWAGSRFRYTGQIALPEVELYHYKARAYDPRTGRFLQTDPSGYEDGLNWYAYVGDDPLNHTDSDGQQRRPVVGPVPGMPRTIAGLYNAAQINSWNARGRSIDPNYGGYTYVGEASARGVSDAREMFGRMQARAADARGATLPSDQPGAQYQAGGFSGTNATGELGSRSSFRKATVAGAWENAPSGPNGGRLCPSCDVEVNNAPGSGLRRDWDVSHNPSWTNRTFAPGTTRQEVIDNYQRGTGLECIACNRSGQNNDSRFWKYPQ